MVSARSLAPALLLPAFVRATSYGLVKEYSGTSFFDGWDFFGAADTTTNGDVEYVSSSDAGSLAFVNDAGNAIIKVDNTSDVTFNNKRNSVKITTSDAFTVGSVWVVDMLHVPYGCSVWPAFWSEGPNWPAGGEIDTFEAVNLVQRNQFALHTEPGCTITGADQTSTLVNSTDCSSSSNNNEGCVVENPSTDSYGSAFSDAGGGQFITEYSSSGINIWFFNRSSIPDSLDIDTNSSSIDTSTLGTPTVNYPSTSCSMSTFFGNQNLIFDITLCGDFAGDTTVFAETCTGVCYNDYVVGNGSNYDTAYFEVQSLRVFGTSSNVVVSGAESILLGSRVSLGSLTVVVGVVLSVVLGGVW